jgi:hypothetical protein
VFCVEKMFVFVSFVGEERLGMRIVKKGAHRCGVAGFFCGSADADIFHGFCSKGQTSFSSARP